MSSSLLKTAALPGMAAVFAAVWALISANQGILVKLKEVKSGAKAIFGGVKRGGLFYAKAMAAQDRVLPQGDL